jgi:hypothetical protein
MGSLTTHAVNNMLDLTLSGVAYTPPASVWLGWLVSPAGADGSGTELTGGGYGREEVEFAAASGGVIETTGPVVVDPLHAADQMVVSWGIFDASTGGNMLAYGRVPSYTVPGGRPLTVDSITIDSNDAALTQLLADAWLDHLFRATAYTPPANPFAALYTTAPTATDPGVELDTDAYARQITTWDLATNATTLLAGDATWIPDNDLDVTITAIGIHDSSTGGDLLLFTVLPTPVPVLATGTFLAPAATIGFRVL